MSREKNIKRYNGCVNRTDREHLNGHKSVVLWFTGLSGAGKTTVANATLRMLQKQAISTQIIDGDEIRKRTKINLSFSPSDIKKNNDSVDMSLVSKHVKNLLS